MTTTTAPPAPPATRKTVSSERSPRRRPYTNAGLITTITWIVALIFVAPAAWLVLTSFKQESDAYTNPPKIIFHPTLSQYSNVFHSGFWTYVGNSAFATIVSTLFVLLLGLPAAYALSIKPVPKTRDVLGFFISTKMLPIVAAIIPIYVVVNDLKLLDNIWTLVVLYTAMNLPIAVWMLRSFLQEIPGEVLEAAAVDGAGFSRTMRSVIFPMISPGIAATALICVIFSWNEFFFAVNLTAARAATVPVFLVGFISSEGLYYAQLAAGAVLASLPVVIAGWVAQRQLVRGLSMGAIK
jgi:sorbitol/mannitol transport system permease protein